MTVENPTTQEQEEAEERQDATIRAIAPAIHEYGLTAEQAHHVRGFLRGYRGGGDPVVVHVVDDLARAFDAYGLWLAQQPERMGYVGQEAITEALGESPDAANG